MYTISEGLGEQYTCSSPQETNEDTTRLLILPAHEPHMEAGGECSEASDYTIVRGFNFQWSGTIMEGFPWV